MLGTSLLRVRLSSAHLFPSLGSFFKKTQGKASLLLGDILHLNSLLVLFFHCFRSFASKLVASGSQTSAKRRRRAFRLQLLGVVVANTLIVMLCVSLLRPMPFMYVGGRPAADSDGAWMAWLCRRLPGGWNAPLFSAQATFVLHCLDSLLNVVHRARQVGIVSKAPRGQEEGVQCDFFAIFFKRSMICSCCFQAAAKKKEARGEPLTRSL